MNILITGADGFVGRTLVRHLLTDPIGSLDPLILVDQQFTEPAGDPRIRQVTGSIADTQTIDMALADPVHLVFHLASIPGGLAERDFDLGLRVNLGGTLALLERLRHQERPTKLVFASSVAVYGDPLPAHVNDDTPARPTLSYAAHKLAAELLMDDYSRRGWVDGRSLRLPGIVARPAGPSGLMSAFMSDVMWAMAKGQPYICPVSPDAVAWWMSAPCCAANLVHAASLPSSALPSGRVWLPPVLRLTMADLVAALADRFGADRAALITYRPDAAVEAKFGQQPPLHAHRALTAGFRHDGTVQDLIGAALLHVPAHHFFQPAGAHIKAMAAGQ